MNDKYEFDIGWLLLILSVLDGNNKKGEENGNESKGSKDIVVLNEED